MAVIHVRALDAARGTEVPGSRLRTGSAEEAVKHALGLKGSHPEPAFLVGILYAGSFVDDAFAELAELAQRHGLDIENGGD